MQATATELVSAMTPEEIQPAMWRLVEAARLRRIIALSAAPAGNP